MTQKDRWAKRPTVLKYHKYADAVRKSYEEYNHLLPDKMELVFFMPMPKSWSKKKQAEMVGKPHRQKPDIDNLIKAFMDALYEEDSVVYSVKAEKYWAETGGIQIGAPWDTLDIEMKRGYTQNL